MTDQAITIDRTGPDWEPGIADGWFAQRGIQGKFAFGASPQEALEALLAAEANDELSGWAYVNERGRQARSERIKAECAKLGI